MTARVRSRAVSALMGVKMGKLTAEAQHYLATGKVSLLFPTADSRTRRMPLEQVIDLHPSPESSAEIHAKRAELLGRPKQLQVELDDQGFRKEEIERDDSAEQYFGHEAVWLIDGVKYRAPDGQRHRAFPDEAEAEERRHAGMIVGSVPSSIIRIPG